MRTIEDGGYTFGADWTALAQLSMQGTYVKSGCVLSDGTNDMEVDVASGTVMIDNSEYSVSTVTKTLDTESTLTDWRYDLFTVDTSETVNVTKGTVNKVVPSIPTDEVPLGVVKIDNGATDIGSTDIYDMRILFDKKVDKNKVLLPDATSSEYTNPSDVSQSSTGADFKESCESGWTYTEQDGNDVISGTQPATDWYVEGDGSLKISGGGNTVVETDYGQFAKDLDLTDIDNLDITVKSDGGSDSEWVCSQIWIGGTKEWELATTSAFEQIITIDVSGYSGTTTIEFKYINKSGDGDNIMGTAWIDFIGSGIQYPKYLKDDDTATYWQPASSDTDPIYCQGDIGSLSILGAIRFYCGSSGVPSNVDIQISEDGSTWETVVTDYSPDTDAWNEVTFPAKYIRYIRLIVSTTDDRIYELDYWSRIVERVASEHGHKA